MLKKIGVHELEPGMYVQEILEQRGNMRITNTGKVKTRAAIRYMERQGILSVAIDPSRAFIPDPEELEETDSSTVSVAEEVDFDLEVVRAKSLHKKGKGIQKRMMDAVMKGLPIDITIPDEFTQHMIGSIDRNPNALMCLTKIREKDSYLLEHSLNVAILLANFAKHMGFNDEEIQTLGLSGFLHDIGKIRIPDAILHKPGRLTDQEMTVMRDHVYYGVRTLQEMDMPDVIIRTMSEHHERLDGYGYPEGARGDEISYYGRMIAIVDTYDAITADRCYKPGMPSQKALKILLKDAPEKYDAELVQRFIKCVGIYPVGSLVKLTNEQVGMVVKQRDDKPLKPVVKVFYSVRGSHYIAPKDIDLSNSQYDVERAVTASELGLDFNRFFDEKIAI